MLERPISRVIHGVTLGGSYSVQDGIVKVKGVIMPHDGAQVAYQARLHPLRLLSVRSAARKARGASKN
jgi:hypothetical protein